MPYRIITRHISPYIAAQGTAADLARHTGGSTMTTRQMLGLDDLPAPAPWGILPDGSARDTSRDPREVRYG